MSKGYITIPIGYKRVDNLPLVFDQLFTSKALADEYVKSDPTAYVGQIFSVIDTVEEVRTVTAYIVTAVGTEGAMKEIGSTPITSYNDLTDKPKIDGHELTGDTTSADLGLVVPSDIANFVTQEQVDNTINQNTNNYQTDSQVTEIVNNAISALGKVFILKGRVDSVEALGSISDPKAGDLYLVGAAGTSDMQEYVYVDSRDASENGSWEHIGDPSVDLSNYYDKTEVDNLLAKKVDVVDGKGLSTNDYDATAKAKVDKIVMENAEGNDELYLGKDGNYHQIPKIDGGELSADYKKLVNKPTVNGTEFNGAVEVSAETTPIDYSSDASSPAKGFTVQLGEGGSIGGYSTGDVIEPGDSILKVLKKILVKSIPATYTAPTFSFSGTGTKEVEIGTKQNITLKGIYTSNDAGDATAYIVTKGAEKVANEVSDMTGKVIEGFQVGTTPVIFTGQVTYGETPTDKYKQNNLGEESIENRIPAGTLEDSVTYTGRRAMFYRYSESDIDCSSSAAIRALVQSDGSGQSILNPINGKQIKISFPTGTKCIVIAYPASLEDLKDVQSANLNLTVKSGFELQSDTLEVESANAYDKVTYKVYKMIKPAALDADTYTVTI